MAWHAIVDRTGNTEDRICELCVLPKAEKARLVRVTNKSDIAVGQFSIADRRVFGHATGERPAAVMDFKAVRQADRRRIAMLWRPRADATGYIVRWGASKDRMNHAARVYATAVDYGFFDSEETYYVAVQPFNDVGLGPLSEIVEVK